MSRTKTSARLCAVLASAAAVVAIAAPSAQANDSIPEGAPLSEFVERSKPEWNMARANGNDSCWPAEAISGDGNLHPGADPKPWPNSDDGCAPVGTPFPTYYAVEECNDAEIRVGYTVYVPNSYFVGGGHKHDFEGVDVVWKRDGDRWTRSALLMGRHGKYVERSWDKVESWNGDRSSAGLGREFPRIFMGWGSHAMFNDQGGLKDIASQSNGNEYRQADYPVSDSALVEVNKDNDMSRKFRDAASHFGSGLQQNPATVADTLCSHKP